MTLLRRRVRRSFLLAAVAFLVLGFVDIARHNYAVFGISPVHHFGLIVFYFVQGVIYAAAWFTTQTQSPYRNNWAVTGSLFTLAWAGYDLWLHHTDILAVRGGPIGLVLAIAGLYVFAQGGSPARSNPPAESESQSAEQIPPCRYSYLPPGERIVRSFKIPAEGTPAYDAMVAAANPLSPPMPHCNPVLLIRAAYIGNLNAEKGRR